MAANARPSPWHPPPHSTEPPPPPPPANHRRAPRSDRVRAWRAPHPTTPTTAGMLPAKTRPPHPSLHPPHPVQAMLPIGRSSLPLPPAKLWAKIRSCDRMHLPCSKPSADALRPKPDSTPGARGRKRCTSERAAQIHQPPLQSRGSPSTSLTLTLTCWLVVRPCDARLGRGRWFAARGVEARRVRPATRTRVCTRNVHVRACPSLPHPVCG